ncbi:unnamed protein product [Adineta ricciae]|uniref:Uncharacterized protein n=1 Tax=Adineta ricciae TaxID=249248 RepID=A0A815B3X8_ADIRI|nr:unnamed protein product [Adineta ricciae]
MQCNGSKCFAFQFITVRRIDDRLRNPFCWETSNIFCLNTPKFEKKNSVFDPSRTAQEMSLERLPFPVFQPLGEMLSDSPGRYVEEVNGNPVAIFVELGIHTISM